MRLDRRVKALERLRLGVQRWHRLIVELGQTEATARAAYESVHGAIGQGEGVIVRVIV